MIIEGKSILDFPGMQLCRSRDESRQINAETEPAVIMSTSGMCTAGRIKFHLKRNIGDPNAAIVFVGYQAHGTLGRQISSGKSPVRIHGRHYDVQAEIVQLSGFSGHTDQAGLLDWIGNFSEGPEQVFLSHGDQEAADELAELIRTQLSLQVSVPEFQQVVTLG